MAGNGARLAARGRALFVGASPWLGRLALLVCFVAALALGAVLHVGLPAPRRVIARSLSSALSSLFMGTFVIEHIDRVGPDGFDGAHVQVLDPQGNVVLDVIGLRARAPVIPFVTSLLWGTAPIDLTIARADATHVDVAIEPDDAERPGLTSALVLRPPATPTPGPARAFKVWLPHVAIDSAHVHGRLGPSPQTEIDLRDLSASVLASSERVIVDAKRFGLNVRPQGLEQAQGTAEGHLERRNDTSERGDGAPSSTAGGSDDPWTIWGGFDGFAGSVQTAARVAYDKGRIKLSVDLPGARAEDLRAIIPDLPIYDTVRVHAEAEGALPVLDARARLVLGDGSADLEGKVDLSEHTSADFYFDARAVPLRALLPDAPTMVAGGSGHVVVQKQSNGAMAGSFEVVTDPTTLGSTPLPSASTSGRFGSTWLDGTSTLYEPGAPAHLKWAVRSAGADAKPSGAGADAKPSGAAAAAKPSGVIVEIEGDARVRSFAAAPRLRSLAEGSGGVTGRATLTGSRVDASFDITLDHASHGPVAAQKATLHATVRGPWKAPGLDAKSQLDGVTLGPMTYAHASVEAHGPLGAPNVGVTLAGGTLPDADLRGRVVISGGRPGVDGVTLHLSRGKLAMTARAATIRGDDSSVDIDGIEIEGAGEPLRASLRVHGTGLTATAHTSGLDLDVIAQALGLPEGAIKGKVVLDGDISVEGSRRTGNVRVKLDQGAIMPIGLVALEGEAHLDGTSASMQMRADLGPLGALDVIAHPVVTGPLFDPKSWRDATGDVVANGRVDLHALADVLPGSVIPFEDLRGTLTAQTVMRRDRKGILPDTELVLATTGLATGPLRTWNAVEVGSTSAAPRVVGIDLQTAVSFVGATGRTETMLRLVDDQGTFAMASVAGALPIEDLWAHPERTGAVLADLPLEALLKLPRRSFDRYPALLRPASVRGELELVVDATGSYRAPSLHAEGNVRGLTPASGVVPLPVDADLNGDYDAKTLTLGMTATREKKEVLKADTRIDLPWNAVLDTDPDHAIPWEAAFSAHLSDLPLEAIPALADKRIAGKAQGDVKVTGLHRDPEMKASIRVRDGRLGGVAFPTIQGHASIKSEMAGASIRLDQGDGQLSASGSSRVAWGREVVPSIAADAPADLYIAASGFRAAALEPVTSDVFTHLDGRIDARLHIGQHPSADGLTQTIDGSAELRDGVFQIPEIGQEFTHATARLSIDAPGAIRLDDLSAHGASGILRAQGEGKLDGFSVRTAAASVKVAEKEAVPLTLEGVSFGDAWGNLLITARHQKGSSRVDVDVNVPALHTEMPDSSGRDVQALGDNPQIHIGRRTSDGKLELIALSAEAAGRSQDQLTWHVAFHLGSEVTVKRGSSLTVTMTGEPIVDLTDKARVSGQVEMPRGQVDIMGKRFQLERGTARFEDPDEPGDPTLAVRARWDAPDGTRVYADYVGPLKTGTLTLSSDPARSRGEILSLLLFGGDAGSSGAPTGPGAAGGSVYAAEGVGGGAISMGVNQVLSGIGHGEISTRVDTSVAQNPRPEVAVRITQDVTAQAGYQTGVVAPGQNPDRMLLKLDWRFLRDWSMTTTFGNSGSSILDLYWQYRY